jgi:hypothetical protein
MRLLALLVLGPMLAQAHMVSMSTAELRLEGARGHYELRLPMYEAAHLPSREKAVFDSLKFAGGGGAARLQERSCREDAGSSSLVCTAEYAFPAEVERVEAECRLFDVTVPNHIHVLRVVSGGRTDQAVFDASFPRAVIAFRAPGGLETLAAAFAAGLVRVAGGAAQLLFLVAVVVVARSRRELLVLAGAFLGAEVASAVVVGLTSWQPAPRFVEAASALTIAYLAVEVLLLPEAGRRWLVVAVLGLFHGLYFAVFLATSGYAAVAFLPGVVMAEVALAALFAAGFGLLRRRAARFAPVRVSAALLGAIGLVWFALRLRS